MDIRLKSKELRKLFGIDVLTDVMAEKRKNNISIVLDGPITSELLEDLENIRRHHQMLLRHTTIVNNSTEHQDLQPIIDILSNYQTHTREDSMKEVKIRSSYLSDFDADFSKLKGLKILDFDKKGVVEKLKIDPKKMPKRPHEGKLALALHGFDLSELDINGTLIKELRLINKFITGFTGIKGLEQLTDLNIIGRDFDQELEDMIRFINSAGPTLNTVFMNEIDFSSRAPFELINNTNLARITVMNSRVRDLTGLDKYKTRLAFLGLKGNILGPEAVEQLQDFMAAMPTMDISITGGNQGITDRFLKATQNGLTQLTIDNILRSYDVSDGPKVINMNTALYRLMEDPTIPISVKDAERIRKIGGVVNNPIEFDKDLDLETFDFSSDYLQGGTLLLTVDQVEQLLKSGKQIPMKVAVQIQSVGEISRADISRYKNQAGIDEVRVITSDGYRCTNGPYTANEYYYIRGVLDEIVEGIDPNEPDVDKVATIYERIINTIAYDHSAINRKSADGLRHCAKENYACRNLLNGLTQETCVCAGYADILRQALSLVGIESKYLYGECFGDPDMYAGHAWVAVKLKDEEGVDRYYLMDPTWDRKSGYKYFLMDGESFTKNGHKVYESTDVPEFAEKEFDKEKKKLAIEKAKTRYKNPRKEFLDKYRKEQEERKAKIEQRKKEQEEKRRLEEERKQEEEKKKQEKEKPEDKKPEDKKSEEEKTVDKKLEEKKVEFVPSKELQGKMDKADYIRQEMNSIYRTLDTALGLGNKGEYYRKLSELEEKLKKLQEEISNQKEKELEEFNKKGTAEVNRPTPEENKSTSKENRSTPEETKTEVVKERVELSGAKAGGVEEAKSTVKEEKKPEEIEKSGEESRNDKKEEVKEENREDVEEPEVLQIVEKKTEEEIKKAKEETEETKKKQEELEKSIKYNAKQKDIDVPKVRTKEDLIDIKKKSRIASWEQGYVNVVNRIFRRDITKPPVFVSKVIKFGVDARFKLQERFRKIFNLKDPYQDEINAINSSKPVSVGKDDLFMKSKVDVKKAKEDYKKSLDGEEPRKEDIQK